MATNQPVSAPPAPDDLPPPYSAVVNNPQQYGFVVPDQLTTTGYPQPKAYTAPGVYPHPPSISISQPSGAGPSLPPPAGAVTVPVGLVLPPAVGSDPTTITCFNCAKVVTTRVEYTTAWHTHLVAGAICVMTMACSMCCLGLIPYCFNTFKDAEHYCPNCNTFIGKCNKC